MPVVAGWPFWETGSKMEMGVQEVSLEVIWGTTLLKSEECGSG